MEGRRVLEGVLLELFHEGVSFILNNWSALQTTVDYELGDNNSHPKVEQLIADVRSWFAQSKEPYLISELTILIKEGMNAAFDQVIKDGSAEKVAAEIIGIHAECTHQKFEIIKLLREREMSDLMVHASLCTEDCQFPNCYKVKGLFCHGMHCETRASGGCVLCKKMWYLIQVHARVCNKSECRVPRCSDLKEHLRKQQQQPNSNSQQRAGCSNGPNGNDEHKVANNVG